jgi:hypothetical protein
MLSSIVIEIILSPTVVPSANTEIGDLADGPDTRLTDSNQCLCCSFGMP